jgi:hypothetical protein
MRRIFALLIIITLPTLLIAQVNQPATNRPVVFRNVTIIDMQSSQPKPQMTVVVVGNRITALGKKVNVPNNAEIVDASGKFMIPVYGICTFISLTTAPRLGQITAKLIFRFYSLMA